MQSAAPTAGIETSIFQLLLLALAALGACAAALFTWFAARATAKANRGQTILSCLDKYISVMKDKNEAIQKKNHQLAKAFYRELFDLHWSEFHLWHEGAIPNDVMRAWIAVRRRNYKSDGIVCTTDTGTEHRISYANEWKCLKDTDYFEMNDPFVTFMDKVHDGDISDIKELKDKTKRRKQ